MRHMINNISHRNLSWITRFEHNCNQKFFISYGISRNIFMFLVFLQCSCHSNAVRTHTNDQSLFYVYKYKIWTILLSRFCAVNMSSVLCIEQSARCEQCQRQQYFAAIHIVRSRSQDSFLPYFLLRCFFFLSSFFGIFVLLLFWHKNVRLHGMAGIYVWQKHTVTHIWHMFGHARPSNNHIFSVYMASGSE